GGGGEAPPGQLGQEGDGVDQRPQPVDTGGLDRAGPETAQPQDGHGQHRPGREGDPVDGPVDEDLLGAAPPAPDLDPDGAPFAVGIAFAAGVAADDGAESGE